MPRENAARSQLLGDLLALVFGLSHLYQGVVGALMATVIGLIVGGAVYAARGSLWPVIIVHAVPDTMSMPSAYRGD